MALPRFLCPQCRRSVAVTRLGRLYRHDPAEGRTPDLKSCPGSLKVVRPREEQPVLFPLAAEPPQEDGAAGPEQAELF